MIKKSIACILVLLIFINTVGCYSKAHLPFFQEDMEELSEGDNIVVITQDGIEYSITVVKIEEKRIYGTTGWTKSQVIIHADDIAMIEIKKFDTGKTLLLGLAGIVCIAGILVIIVISAKFD
jgi:hypothetical protein